MRWTRCLWAAAAVAILPAWAQGSDGRTPASNTGAPNTGAPKTPSILDRDGPVFTDGTPRGPYEPLFLARGQDASLRATAARFGWWAMNVKGNGTKIGEYQGLESSAFFDLDHLASDGCRTLDFSITGTEGESTSIDLYFFGPRLSADFEYERFLHRLDHQPLDAFLNTPNTPVLAGEDRNLGEDFAIRVNEIDTTFKGRVSENVRWRLNLWAMRKHGERQAIAMNHSTSCRQCHVLSQAKSIDWLTMQIEPVVEARLGPVTAEYSHTVRSFTNNDGVVTRSYDGFPVRFIDPTLQYPDFNASENLTQIDRLKLSTALPGASRFYGVMYFGDTQNKYRKTHRDFDGFDLRLTNRYFADLTLTGYARHYEEKGQIPTTFPEDDLFPDGRKPSQEVREQVARQKTTAGIKGRWLPFYGDCSVRRGLALTAGYEFRSIDRQHVTYEILGPDDDEDVVFTQPNTAMNFMHVGTEMRWSPCFDTFVRYRMGSISDPLLGVRESDEATVDHDLQLPSDITALNTNRPKHEDLVQFGGTWFPSESFLLSAWIGIEKRNHRSAAAQFQEDDYPIVLTAWYAPTCRFSFSGGLGFYSNWIDQDITFGNLHGSEPQDTQPVNYWGRTTVVNLGSRYACTDRLALKGEFEWARGRNAFFVPSPDGADWSALPTFSDVITETTRFTAGADYRWREGISCYVYYVYYDWLDKAGNGESGTANMFLGGLTAVY